MPSQLQSFNLLILTSREDEARGIVSSLRNGGLPARGIYTNRYDQLAALADGQVAVDLILCCLNDPEMDLDQVMEHYREIETDVPLILLASSSHDADHLARALRDGARDLVEHGQIERLQAVVARELADLRARQGLARALRQAERCEERICELAEAADDAFAFVRDGVLLFANSAYRQRFGLAHGDKFDEFPLLDLIAARHHEALSTLIDEAQAPDGGDSLPSEIAVTALRSDGRPFPAAIVVKRDEYRGKRCARLKVSDISQQIAQQANALAQTDAGLPNRAVLISEISERLSRASSGDPVRFALIYIGINGFAEIVAHTGLMRAYEIAADFSATLQAIAPDHGLLTRFADESFMLLLDTEAEAEAAQLAVEIRREIRLPISLPGRDTARADCLTGVAFFDEERNPSLRELIDGAYADAFTSSASGAEPDTPPLVHDDASGAGASPVTDAADREIGQMIDGALQREGLILVYQPIISLLGDSQENYSVFVRLIDDQQRLHEARDLIGPAVRTRHIEAVDRWVIEQAVGQVAEQRKNGQKVNFFVNLAEETFQRGSLLLWLCDQLRDSEVRGNWLTFQFQEVHARLHLAKLARLVEGMKKIKARVALSRFGHDPQPESLLQALQADFVLFAPDFAQQLSAEPAKQKQLIALANLAREFNAKTIVTGVEDATTLTVLWGAGIDYVQGNFLQRPSTALSAVQE